MPGIGEGSEEIEVTLNASIKLDKESLKILRESVKTFRGCTAPEMTYKAWHELVGSWASDIEDAKLKDPSLDSAITGQSTSVLSWKKILNEGLRSYIDECRQNIDKFIASGQTDINKVYFGKSAIIVLKAVINHAHRYAALARKMAENESDSAAKERLLKIARSANMSRKTRPETSMKHFNPWHFAI